MARTRQIKPAFFHNDELAECPPLARLLFIGLWGVSDFNGFVEYRPKKLKAQLLPYDDCNIEELIETLHPNFVKIYQKDGKTYLQSIKFADHQHPHKNEIASGSNIPDLGEEDENHGCQAIDNKEQITKDGTSTVQGRNLDGTNPPFNLKPLTLNLKPNTLTIPDFEELWKMYPRTRPNKSCGVKNKALDKCNQLIKKGTTTYEEIKSGVIRYKAYCEQGGTYNSDFTTWLGTNKGYLEQWEFTTPKDSTIEGRPNKQTQIEEIFLSAYERNAKKTDI